jgi:hypothetical protein
MKSIVMLGGLVILVVMGGLAVAQESYQVRTRVSHQKQDQDFYRYVKPLIQNFHAGLIKQDGTRWKSLCAPQDTFSFRYLGQYNTTLSCQEFQGLTTETKSRWWGRSDGTGKPVVGTFAKVWSEKLQMALQNHEWRGVNVFLRSGNAIDHKMGKLPFVDLTWSGPKAHEPMGWFSIRLFFHHQAGQWTLKGLDIYHWTI